MSFLTANYGYWEFWAPYQPTDDVFGGQKVTFDGINRLIIINPDVTSLSVKTDIYSNWKEWVMVRDNSKFLPAIRTVGGDPISDTESAGDIYFLINDWQILIDHSCQIDGVIYSDDFPSPFLPAEDAQIVTNKVAAIVQNAGGSGGSNCPTAEQIRIEIDQNSTALQSIQNQLTTIENSVGDYPTPTEIASAVRVELAPELAKVMTLENNPGLTPTQATMLLEMYDLLGLDPTKPLVVTTSGRFAGSITQTIATSPNETVVTRV